MLCFGGSTSQTLAREVSRIAGFDEGSLEVKTFPDGELYVRIETPVQGEDCAVIQSTSRPQGENLLELLAVLETLRDMGAEKVAAVVPYYGYGRQDRRFKEGECVTSKMVAEHIQLHCDEFYTINIHKEAILDFFDIPAHGLDAAPLLGEYFKGMDLEDPLVVGPDMGAQELATRVSEVLGCDKDCLEKKRLGPGQVEMKPKGIETAGKDIIIVDDIIDSGGTMLTALKTLKAKHASSVSIACIHPVLTGNIITRLYAAGARVVAATDTIPSQISEISVASLIADALK